MFHPHGWTWYSTAMTHEEAIAVARPRLIFALDVGSAAEAREYVARLAPEVSFFKIGLELFIAAGPAMVEWLVGEGHRVFLDLKILDIATTVGRAVAAAGRLGAEVVTVHAEPAVLDAAARGKVGGRPQVFAVSLLTSEACDFASDRVAKVAGMAVACGIDGLIVAGHAEEIAAVRAVNPALAVICPGIRPVGSDPGDQRRVATPAAAMAAGADYLVVGRPIRDAADPLAAAQAILAEMAEGLLACG